MLDCTENNKKVVEQLQTDSKNNKQPQPDIENILIEKLFDLYRADPAMTPLRTLKQTLHEAVDGCTNENWRKVSSCRLVFAQFMTKPDSNTITGVLFYSDTHYGENLIDFNEEQLRKIQEDCTNTRPCFNKLTDKIKQLKEKNLTDEENRQNEEKKRKVADEKKLAHELKSLYEQKKYEYWILLLKKLCQPCKHRMLQVTINQIEKDDKKIFPFDKVGRLTLTYENKQLIKICLQNCADAYKPNQEEAHKP